MTSFTHGVSVVDRPAQEPPPGRGNLQERLRLRHHNAVAAFRATLQRTNAEVDARQQSRLLALKQLLHDSHHTDTERVQAAQARVDAHTALLDAQAARLREADAGQVLPWFHDDLHPVPSWWESENEDELRHARVLDVSRVAAERGAVTELALSLRTSHDARVAAIERCMHEVAAEEQTRARAVQAQLRAFMLELATISYRGVTEAHVLAQRVLHRVNATLTENYAAHHTLLHELRQREVLRLRERHETVAALYTATVHRLARSHVYAVSTLLRSAPLRRPAHRVRAAAELRTAAHAARTSGVHFLQSLQAMVDSLAVAPTEADVAAANVQDPTVPLLCCGGSLNTGWLREYDPCVARPVFADDAATLRVVEEWRMKASVVLRHTLGDCLAVVESTRQAEQTRVQWASEVCDAVVQEVRTIYEPSAQDVARLRQASLGAPTLDACFAHVLANADDDDNRVALRREVDAYTTPQLHELREESAWFVHTLDAAARRGHAALETTVLTSYTSVLRGFEKATEVLVGTVRRVHGEVRAAHRALREADLDHADEVARQETLYAELCARVLHAGAVSVTEELGAEGLRGLQRIAALHSRHHRRIMAQLQTTQKTVEDEAAAACDALRRRLGVESIDESRRRWERERQARRDAAAAPPSPTPNRRPPAVHGKSTDESRTGTRARRRESADSDVALGDVEEEEEEEEEEPQYAQVTVEVGPTTWVYNVVAPLQLIESTSEPQRSESAESVPAMTTSSSLAAVRESYAAVLQELLHEPELFVAHDAVAAWEAELRVGLLRWVVALQTDMERGVAAYCAASALRVQTATNHTLRHHRRRPATFQADFVEVRQRELETKTNAAEKYCARLRERLVAVQTRWAELQHDAAADAADAAVLQQLGELVDGVSGCGSMSALQSHGRRAEGLLQRYLDTFREHYQTAVTQLERQYAAMEQECAHYRRVRAAELTEETTSSTDAVTQRVRRIEDEVQSSLRAMQETCAAQQRQRVEEVDAVKTRYAAAARKRTAELLLLHALHELTAGVRLQVKSLVQHCDSDAAVVEAAVTELERVLDIEVQSSAVVASVRALAQRDEAALIHAAGHESQDAVTTSNTRRAEDTSKATRTPLPSADEFAGAGRDGAVRALHASVHDAAVTAHRTTHAGPAAAVLRALDALRVPLYTRGVRLDALASSVELTQVPLTAYVTAAALPRPSTLIVRDGSGGDGTRPGRKGRTGVDGVEDGVEDVTPRVTRYATELRQRIAEATAEANRLVHTFTDNHGEDDAVNATALLQRFEQTCEAQLLAAQAHLAKARREYGRLVQRLQHAVRRVPAFLALAVYTVAAETLRGRVREVLERFGQCYGTAAALRVTHQRTARVSLGARRPAPALAVLATQEQLRQNATRDLIREFWANALHAVREELTRYTHRVYHAVTAWLQLDKGLITPAHLTACETEPETTTNGSTMDGPHGLRQLRRRRQLEQQRAAQVRQWQEQHRAVPARRERRLQETMPLHKIELGTKNKTNALRGGGGVDVNGLTLASYVEVRCEGVAVPTPALYDAFQVHFADDASVVHVESVDVTPEVGSHPGTARGVRGRSEDTDELATTAPPFCIVPNALNTDLVDLAVDSVGLFTAMAQEVAQEVDACFGAWHSREQQWAESWTRTLARLMGHSEQE